MTLRNFPVDQQKLTFAFSTGTDVRKTLRISPGAVDAGTFSIANYKLGTVLMWFTKTRHKKGIHFEMMLECLHGYYVTNVAIPSGIFTYLCFISYTPLSDGSLMDTGDRVQIVLTLLLKTVTFTNMVASLTPQISYFTTLCVFLLHHFENAYFSLFVSCFSTRKSWQEHSLLGFPIDFFTLMNIVWVVLNRDDSDTSLITIYTTLFATPSTGSSMIIILVVGLVLTT
ncbi:hypothetical protein PHMEG_00038358 [Phytophthora megakarya]|uniref:Uncharacterized protein n=1 Tax=Phytophthora megakarya TaxID=4795 RepID=A0A225UHL3_9STRA|nr:hypothetical protein PHMEG_00038358 [Phytophthora megakarya]